MKAKKSESKISSEKISLLKRGLLAAVLVILMFMAFSATASAAIINVPSAGNETVQQAINNASAGDTILVDAATYAATETVIVNKSDIIIRSVNGTAVVSAGGASDHVFNITDQTNVTLQGFEIRDAHGTTQAIVAGIYMNNASECNISDNTVTNISAAGAPRVAIGIWLDSSSDNSFHTATVYNLSAYYALGIWLDSSSGNSFVTTTVYNLSADDAYGIHLVSFSSGNSFVTTTVYNLSADDNAYGILLFYYSSDNSFDTSTVYNLSADDDAYGIYLWCLSDDNSFSSGSISDINAPTWWDFYSDETSHRNSAENITISSYPTTISFTYDNGVKIKSVETPPPDPALKSNIGKYVDATNVTANSWLFLNVSYNESDLGGVDENSLRMWKHDETDWTEVPGTNGVNTAENYVYANITSFSVFAPLGNHTVSCTCGDICVDPTGWWRDGVAFNASNTPIQHAIDNATVGDTICVKDGTYNENVVVAKSHLTIRSQHGPSATTVSASLNPDEHVFDITDQTNVTLEGFEIRDAHGTNQHVAGIYMYNASECNISDNTVTNISATGDNTAYGIYLYHSSNNSFDTSTVYNLSANDDAYGIYLYYYSNNNSFDTSTVYNLSANDDAYGIYLASSDNSFHTSTVYNLSAYRGARGISLSSSSDNSFHTSTVYNLSANHYAHGIHLSTSSDNSFHTSTVYNLSANHYYAYGIDLYHSSNNSFDTTTVYNLSANNDAYGIRLRSSSDNNSFHTSTVYNISSSNNDAYGIYLYFLSNNSFISGSISDINAPTWWDFYSNQYAHGNSAENITISSYPTTISFTYDNGVGIKSVETPPPDPVLKSNIGKYVSATNVTANSWLFLNVSYNESDLGGVDENSLRMWKHNGTNWTEVQGTNGVNTVENYVYANITDFSVFAPLGDPVTSITIPTATGTGNVTITTSSGYFCNETDALPMGPPNSPALTFPHGFFNVTICGLNDQDPENVTINFTFPTAIPMNAEFWKYNSSNGTWYPYPFGDNDGDNVISITITDNNATGDHNPVLGVINDPNGIGWPAAAEVPALTPIGLIALIGLLSVIAAMSISMRRKK